MQRFYIRIIYLLPIKKKLFLTFKLLMLLGSVYYPEVPMLTQPLEMKIDEELRNNVSSSLANIGTDEKEEKYDMAFDDTKKVTDTESKTSSSETEKDEGNQDDILMDGDATPKVSRVSVFKE